MAGFFSYKNKKTNFNLFYDVSSIAGVTLVPIKEYAGLRETNSFNDSKNKDNYDDIMYNSKLLLKIYFKNTDYYEKFIFDQEDNEAHIIYDSLIDCINKNSN